MGLRNLLREQRDVNGGVSILDVWGKDAYQLTGSGSFVSQASALTLTAIYDAVRVISDPICTFPIGTYIRSAGERKPFYPQPLWVQQPDPDPAVGRSDHYQQLMVSLLLNGNYYGRILRDARGEPIAIAALDPTLVEPRKNKSGLVEFVVRGADGPLPSSEIVHITELRKPGAVKGTSRIDELRETFGIGKALDEYVARYFKQGALSSTVITTPLETTEEQAERLKARIEAKWSGVRNAHRANVLSGGADVKRLGDNAEQAQLTAARDFFVLEVSRAFKIPPSKLGVNTPGTRAYASVEQDNIDFASTTLAFYVAKIEEAYSRLLAPQAAFIKLNMDALLRGDLKSRFEAYSTGIDAGMVTANEARRREDLVSLPGGDDLRQPLENVGPSTLELIDQQKRVEMFKTLTDSGVSAESAAAIAGLPPVSLSTAPTPDIPAA